VRIGVITGTGTYSLPGYEEAEPEEVGTAYGPALVSRGGDGDVELLHVSRHDQGHRRLSNQVNHRANIAALVDLGAEAVLGVTVCGAVDPTVELGSLLVFDDLHFLANRLGDGSLCTFHTEPGHPARGHWIFEQPFSEELRSSLAAGARDTGHPHRPEGCYGHVDGPRFNTRAEIRGLAAAGVTAVSQTAGPEVVLCGEAELPYALLGCATDYANGVTEEATPVDELLRLIGRSTEVFATVLAAALRRLAQASPAPPGIVYRFEA
jgi:5'-methylthioadenosine phosphorylase